MEPAGEAEALMREIAAGREVALARLIAQLGPAVTRFATRFLGSAADGDEVAQDCFLRVWREAGRFDPGRGRAAAWVFRIAANLCIDRQRRARVRRLFGLGAAALTDDLAADPAPGAEAVLAARQRLAAVRRALAALPDRQRMALLLAAVAGLETPAIAAIIGTSRGAAEQLLVRARAGLRARLEAGLGDDDERRG